MYMSQVQDTCVHRLPKKYTHCDMSHVLDVVPNGTETNGLKSCKMIKHNAVRVSQSFA